MSKQPLIPSLLYTTAEQSVKDEVQDELKVPDPDTKVAEAAIEEATLPKQGEES